MSERPKVEIEHPDWRGGGFQCLTCAAFAELPPSRKDDDKLLCFGCNLWRDMAEVVYVAPRQTQEKEP